MCLKIVRLKSEKDSLYEYARVKKVKKKITHVCVPGTRSKEGGVSIFGSGANGGHGHPDIECLPIEEIEEKN